jgi:hypothetical protein
LEIKKLLKKVKDTHIDNGSNGNRQKKPLSNSSSAFDSFKPEDTAKKGIGLKEGIFIEIPETIEEPIPIEEKPEILVEENYSPPETTENYIIQSGDTVKSIAKKVFGNEEMAKKLIEWKFIKSNNDLIPGQEIFGLKYLNLDSQLAEMAKNFNMKVETVSPVEQNKIILRAITKIARDNNVPPVVAIAVCSSEIHWMNIQGAQEKINFPVNYQFWQPLQVNSQVYPDVFPEAAMNIDFNINFGINILKNLKKSQKTWPKTITTYFLDSPVSIGKPSEQKIKALTGSSILSEIIIKMGKKEFEKSAKAQFRNGDENYITYDFLLQELIKYRNYLQEKYL